MSPTSPTFNCLPLILMVLVPLQEQGGTPRSAPPETHELNSVVDDRNVHWSFQPIESPAVPAAGNRSWVRNPIDAFVLSRLESESISPSPEADKNTLIRRVSLDLVGLPPSPDQISSFLSDECPDAYERLVDRLLSSPHYGERWALYWLDLARFADSDGYEGDRMRPHAWRYREWVINALNEDMRFDQFTIEQIAGDLLPEATTQQKVATGFHRNTLTNREGGVDVEQFRFEQLVDRTRTVGTVWLGLTVECAQCHDHKYDPITQKDYYRLLAFFNSDEEVNIDAPLAGEMGSYVRGRPEYDAKREQLLQEYGLFELQRPWELKMLQASTNPGRWPVWDDAYVMFRLLLDNGETILGTDPDRRTRKERLALTAHFVDNYGRVITKERSEKLRLKELRKKLDTLNRAFPALSEAQTIAASVHPRKSYIHIRGDYRNKGTQVEPATPDFLHPMPQDSDGSRLTLARWLVAPNNPVTPRVTVNRLWQELLGRGIVRTSEDFGSRGDRPSHPQLLDWLANDFVSRGWSLKKVMRRIVTSATYRQSSARGPEMESRDPDNVLLSRQNRLRLPAELIRDSSLAVSGLLYPAIGGRSVRPPQPEAVTGLMHLNFTWEESQGRDRYRRGLYVHRQRSMPYPLLQNFDAPEFTVTLCRRERSNTPLQALNLLNDPVFFEAAQALAVRILREVPGSFDDRLDHAFQLCLSRPPYPSEQQRMSQYFARKLKLLDEGSAESLFPIDLEGESRIEAAAWVGLSSILLNLDEFITRE